MTERVPGKFAKSLLTMVQQRGHDVREALDSVGIAYNSLDDKQLEIQPEITLLQYSKLYQHVLALLQDESFGLGAGQGVTPGAFRMMCYAIIHCENLGKAMRRACQFFSIFYERPFHLQLEVDGDVAAMGYPEFSSLPERYTRASDAYALSAWQRFCAWLIGRSLDLEAVHFCGSEPPEQEKYTELFQASVSFDQPQSRFYFPASYLQCPIVQNERSLREFLRNAPYQLMVGEGENETGSLVSQVKTLMGYDFSEGFPSFEQIASALHMSAPTLRRHLKREGSSYQVLKDNCRRDAAVAYLSRPDLSINAVATLMGFTDPSAFHRSFKKWTGIPPGQFRVKQSVQLQAK